MQGMETAYVGNGVSASEASTTVGTEVIKAVAQKYQTNNQIGKATIEIDGFGTVENVTGDATVTVYTTDFIVEGTVLREGGQLTWGEIEDNVPGIKIINVPSFIAKDRFATLDVKRRDISQDAQVTWTSLTPDYAIVNSSTGKVTGVAEGTAIIKASVIDDGTTYTAQCTIPVREVVVPQVGDFVNYDAGTWTADSSDGKIKLSVKDKDGISSTIDANTSLNLPSSKFQFGGFLPGNSKNGNATSYNTSTYNYVKEKKTEDGITTTTDITGWRIFDISDDGLTLISAGCTEDYYHPFVDNCAYISEYILSGNVNSSINASDLELGTSYLRRDWTADYVNNVNKAKGITASIITKSKLEDWYKKYINFSTVDLYNESNIFKLIYKTNIHVVSNGKYESLIDNYSYYYLGSTISGYPKHLCCVQPDNNNVWLSSMRAYGLRVLIHIPAGINLTENPLGTKTITSRNNDYIYNVWGIN